MGSRGPTGKTGLTGARGPIGPAGPAGATGPKLQRADVLAMVDDQFTEIRGQLNTQLVRMGQIQQQLDMIHAAIQKLIRQDAVSN